MRSTTITSIALWGFIITAIISLALLGAGLYVAWHFLEKVW